MESKAKLYFNELNQQATSNEVGDKENISSRILDDIQKIIDSHLDEDEVIKDTSSFEENMEEVTFYFNTRSFGIDPTIEGLFYNLLEDFIADHS